MRCVAVAFVAVVPLCSSVVCCSILGFHRWLGCSLVASSVLYGATALAAPNGCDEQALGDQAHRAKTWRYTWSGVNAGLMAGSFVAVPLVERASRPDWIVSGIGSGVTALATLLLPLRAESAADELEALPPTERARQLPRLQRESAIDEHARVTWPWHVVNFGLSAAAGSVIAFGYRHYASGVVTTVVGTALGEAQLFTQPTGLPLTCPSALQLVPRLSFTPKVGSSPAAWTLAVGGGF